MSTPPARHVTPLVRQMAERSGVDVHAVTGTGVGGRVTVDDVRRATPQAARARTRDAVSPRARSDRRMRPLETGTVVSMTRDGRAVNRTTTTWDMAHDWEAIPNLVAPVDPFAANPLLDHYKATMGTDATERIRRAAEFGSPPTLFKAGDLPRMTASGADPGVLRDLPWRVRHAAASANSVELARILEDCGTGSDYDVAVAEARYGEHLGNSDYDVRMRTWTMASPEQ